MKNYSKKVAASMAATLIKEAYVLTKKPKLTREELKALRRFRELAGIIRKSGV